MPHLPRRKTIQTCLLLCTALLLAPYRLCAEDTPPPLSAVPSNLAEMRQLEQRFGAVADKVLGCTVGIRNGSSSGSGVIVSEDGYVLTAGHVIRDANLDVTVILPDGKQVKAKTLGAFKSADAGLIKISDEGKWPYAPKGTSQSLLPGTWCVATGHPLGYQEKRPPVLRVGRLLNVDERVLQSDCPLVGGDSGGPLFDLDGKVIGINSRIGSSVLQNFHVPIEIFDHNWERLVKGDVWEAEVPTRSGDDMKATLTELVANAGQCAVRILSDDKEVALGTIVGPDGWILTKASELKGKVVCRLDEQRQWEAQVVGVDPRFDLAMLKVDAVLEPRIQWVMNKPEVGQWVATPGPDGKPLAIGVVSVPRRAIPLIPGALGVVFTDGDEGAEIERVLPKSPAEKAGLQVKDVIKAINGRLAASRADLIKLVKQLPPGAAITLKVLRSAQELDLKATLGKIESPGTRQRDMQNSLGVGVSRRRDNFPVVLQHDSVLRPTDCGGPLVDLSGKVVGVNIARGGAQKPIVCPPTC